MENSADSRGPMTSPEIRAFAEGYGDGPIQSPLHVAWLLESAALGCDWRDDNDMGSENDLIERFAASRDVVRGAIRIVEARGSMRMRRGCRGGLHLQAPSVQSAALALAIYLRSHGYAVERFEKVRRLAGTLLTPSTTGRIVAAVLEQAGAILADGATLPAGSDNRAEQFAMGIIERAGSLPEEGVRIGNEADLCEAFGLGHRTFRQALNILEDLDMLRVSLGRGGGYTLTPASPIGVIRRLFVLLASRQVRSAEVNETLWKLDIAKLRLVFDPACGIGEGERRQWAEALVSTTEELTEPRRWVRVQQALGRLADDRLIEILTSALIAYVARTAPPLYSHAVIEDGLAEAERGLIASIASSRSSDAERYLLSGQNLLSSLSRSRLV